MSTILVVDDSNYARRMLRQTLEQAGYTVVEAGSGLGALESFSLQQPDLILLDLTMEDMSGLDVLEQLRQSGNEVPVIVISADVQQSTEKLVQDAGAVRFVGKPVAPAQLLRTVADIVGGGET
jgi:two-component system, chemotaxis family, chemotaxis protein CheY